MFQVSDFWLIKEGNDISNKRSKFQDLLVIMAILNFLRWQPPPTPNTAFGVEYEPGTNHIKATVSFR